MVASNPDPCPCGARSVDKVRWIKAASSGVVKTCRRDTERVAQMLIARPQVLRVAVERSAR